MLACSLVLVLAGEPEPDALPGWQEVPEPVEPSELPKPKVPNDGSGMITLGSLLLASGAVTTTAGVAVAIEPELSPTGSPGVAGLAGAVQLGAGTVFLTLGLVIRRQFRAKPAVFGAPRTGGAMLLGGVGLVLGGTAYAAHAIINLGSELCTGGTCQPIRPIAAPIQLGCSLAAMLAGTGLVVAGGHRRAGYLRWEQQRIQPSLTLAPGSLGLSVSGQF